MTQTPLDKMHQKAERLERQVRTLQAEVARLKVRDQEQGRRIKALVREVLAWRSADALGVRAAKDTAQIYLERARSARNEGVLATDAPAPAEVDF